MEKLSGKVALITGASRGIGEGVAEALAAGGADLALLGRDTTRLERNAEAAVAEGGKAVAVTCGVTDEAQGRGAVARAVGRFGKLDLLINNAGVSEGGPIDELSVETWDKVIAANLRGPFLCTREAFRIMKAAGGGRIINVASIAARRVRPHTAPYSASKHGVWGLTQVTALEGREFGIACSAIYPGNTLVEKLRHRKEAMMSVADL